MDLFNSVVRGFVGGLGLLFGGAGPFLSLAAVSILTGIALLWAFRKTSDQAALRRTKKKLQAYLLELRLYGDDLSLVWQAQKNLLLENMRYLRLMMRPALAVLLPVVILLIHLDAFYGMTPLQVGEPAVVTIQASRPIGPETEPPRLEAPAEITVETPAVRALEPSQFSWRIRPLQEVDGRLRFAWEGREWEKTIAAGDRPRYLSVRRVRSWMDSFLYPGEDRLALDGIEWVEVRYPPSSISLAGVELHWLIWFFVISMASAFALKGRFKVEL